MCITKIEAYSFDGKTYPREIEAVSAAVTKILDGNEGVGRKVVNAAAALIPYLERAVMLTAVISQEQTASEAGWKDPVSNLTERSVADLKTWLEEEGFQSIHDLQRRGTYEQKERFSVYCGDPPPSTPIADAAKAAEKDPAWEALGAYDRRATLVLRIRAWAKLDKPDAREFLKGQEYADLLELSNKAPDGDINLMHSRLDELGVAQHEKPFNG